MRAGEDMEERLLDEALAWHHALDADDADWDGYTLWLEADPRHRAAFDEVALVDRIVADHAARLRTMIGEAETARPKRRGWTRPWVAGSLAAALAVAIGLPVALQGSGDVEYATTAGQTRRIALTGGIAVDLAPASTLIVKRGDTTRLELARGEAFFDVAHDPNRTLAIKAGDYAVTDIGTRFGMNLAGEALTVSVADGQVAVDPDGPHRATRVLAGQQLLAHRHSGGVTLASVPTANIGSWRKGRLIYSNAPLSVVAADISRYSGKDIEIGRAHV